MTGLRSSSDRGAVLPSPVVLLSILAVALAAVAFVATRGDAPDEREVTQASSGPSESASPTEEADETEPAKPKKTPKPVVRSEVGVVVFNNTNITGLAGGVLDRVAQAGWVAVAADDWRGTVPSTTVYYPQGMRAAGKQLALDLGVARVMPADTTSNMSTSNLTVIVTGALE